MANGETSKPSSSNGHDARDKSTSDSSSLESTSPSKDVVGVSNGDTKDSTAIDTTNDDELVHKMSHLKLTEDS